MPNENNEQLLRDNTVLVLDGAAGTYLESKGVKLHPKLWSSGELLSTEGHKNIRSLHRAYIDAGADVITTVTYQASIPGLVATGLSESESANLITEAVKLAKTEVESSTPQKQVRVAAGLGPYGAYLSNGEEYTGDYGSNTTYEVLREFWVPRVKAALSGAPDILLFETVPNCLELKVIINEAVPLAQEQQIPVWISLSLHIPSPTEASSVMGREIGLADGTSLTALRQLIDPEHVHIQMVGANCFDVRAVPRVIKDLGTLRLPLILYPNSGEIYDGENKTWCSPHDHEFTNNLWNPAEWSANGVRVIGGCCRTSPSTISNINALLEKQ